MDITSYQIINSNSNLTIRQGLALAIFLLCLSIFCFIIKEYRYWKYVRITQRQVRPDEQQKIKRKPIDTITQILLGSMICFSALYLLSAHNIIQTAKEHGMYQSFSEITWKETIENINHTPVETPVPEDPTNSILIFYRFGCPDCAQTYATCKLYFADATDKVYWVSSRSEQGKKLVKQYHITEVPSGVYVRKPQNGITYILYRTKNGKAVLDTDAAQTLLNLQH